MTEFCTTWFVAPKNSQLSLCLHHESGFFDELRAVDIGIVQFQGGDMRKIPDAWWNATYFALQVRQFEQFGYIHVC